VCEQINNGVDDDDDDDDVDVYTLIYPCGKCNHNYLGDASVIFD